MLLKSKSQAEQPPIEQPTPAVEPLPPKDDEQPTVEQSEEESMSPRSNSELSVPDQAKDPPLLDAVEPARRSTREGHPPVRYKNDVQFL